MPRNLGMDGGFRFLLSLAATWRKDLALAEQALRHDMLLPYPAYRSYVAECGLQSGLQLLLALLASGRRPGGRNEGQSSDFINLVQKNLFVFSFSGYQTKASKFQKVTALLL
jgi:hypothetical protein